MPDVPAIDGFADASDARVMLYQSGRQVHAPARAIGLQPLDAGLTAIAALSPADGAVMIGNGSAWTADTTPTLTGLLTVNGQIAFPATQNPSAGANTLDDYEEGTWTPTLITDGTGFGSVTYDAVTAGKYTKIGRMVAIVGRVRTDAITMGSASGSVVIGGLPFTVAADPAGALAVGLSTGWDAGRNPSVIELNGGTTSAYPRYPNAAGGPIVALAAADVATGANANDIAFGGVYFM